MDLMTGHSPFAALLPVLRIDNNTQRLIAWVETWGLFLQSSRTYIQKLELTS